MESDQIQLEFTAMVAEVPDSSMTAKAAKKERARAFARLRREKQAEDRRQQEELVEMYVKMGLSHCFYGEYEKSVAACLRALELDPTHTSVREYLVTSYMHLKEYDSAQDHLIDALRNNPDDAWAHAGLGLYYWKAELNFELAEQLLNRALVLDPGYSKAHSMLGKLKCVEERFEEAQGHFDQAIQYQPENADAHFGRVMTCLAQNSIEDAERALKLFVQQADTEDPESTKLIEKAKEIVLYEKKEFH